MHNQTDGWTDNVKTIQSDLNIDYESMLCSQLASDKSVLLFVHLIITWANEFLAFKFFKMCIFMTNQEDPKRSLKQKVELSVIKPDKQSLDTEFVF